MSDSTALQVMSASIAASRPSPLGRSHASLRAHCGHCGTLVEHADRYSYSRRVAYQLVVDARAQEHTLRAAQSLHPAILPWGRPGALPLSWRRRQLTLQKVDSTPHPVAERSFLFMASLHQGAMVIRRTFPTAGSIKRTLLMPSSMMLGRYSHTLTIP